MPKVLSGSQYIDELKKRALLAENIDMKRNKKKFSSQSLLTLKKAMNDNYYNQNIPPKQYQALYPQTINNHWNQNKNYRRR